MREVELAKGVLFWPWHLVVSIALKFDARCSVTVKILCAALGAPLHSAHETQPCIGSVVACPTEPASQQPHGTAGVGHMIIIRYDRYPKPGMRLAHARLPRHQSRVGWWNRLGQSIIRHVVSIHIHSGRTLRG